MEHQTTITARFDVTGWEEELPGVPGDWLGAAVMRKTCTEGLAGESIAHFVSSCPAPAQAPSRGSRARRASGTTIAAPSSSSNWTDLGGRASRGRARRGTLFA
ncbi:hypothetical protein [Leifsonia shinshuensis]|uniref:hypothetical protein n=1 Tax=Leifsonia shinshuensis TaxID=150026 RepID=UPI001F504D1F|nr:hypothetical protein [Leifsonia shinshuensis]